jgi:hypothetical protein
VSPWRSISPDRLFPRPNRRRRVSWDELERTTAWQRPDDWRDRPDGPDELDWIVYEARASGAPLTRATLLAAMTPEARDRWSS